jgi:hypothetical protein
MSGSTNSDEADLIIERLSAKDELTFQRGDTLDVKASIVLVVVTFLAAQSVDLLSKGNLTSLERFGQVVAIVSLALAGIVVWLQLWPREYEIEAAEKLFQWRAELCKFFEGEPDAGSKVSTLFKNGIIERTVERIEVNGAINKTRSSLLVWSYVFTTLSLGINLVTLLGIGFSQRPS